MAELQQRLQQAEVALQLEVSRRDAALRQGQLLAAQAEAQQQQAQAMRDSTVRLERQVAELQAQLEAARLRGASAAAPSASPAAAAAAGADKENAVGGAGGGEGGSSSSYAELVGRLGHLELEAREWKAAAVQVLPAGAPASAEEAARQLRKLADDVSALRRLLAARDERLVQAELVAESARSAQAEMEPQLREAQAGKEAAATAARIAGKPAPAAAAPACPACHAPCPSSRCRQPPGSCLLPPSSPASLRCSSC